MPKKILIIDDEQDMRVYLGALFRQAGYETATAENGIEGLRQALAFQPDLITLDIMMPKRSGVKTYRELRSAPETRGVPVVVLTGLTRQEDFFGGDLGDLPPPEAVVEKPIQREQFLKQVGEIIGG
jgi:CheY-like chemotaxis protein